MKRELTLKECLEIMKEVNKSDDWNCFFSNGKMVIESKFFVVYDGN